MSGNETFVPGFWLSQAQSAGERMSFRGADQRQLVPGLALGPNELITIRVAQHPRPPPRSSCGTAPLDPDFKNGERDADCFSLGKIESYVLTFPVDIERYVPLSAFAVRRDDADTLRQILVVGTHL